MRVVAIALTAAMTLTLAGCGGDTKPVEFGGEDLPGLVLRASDLPNGMQSSVETTSATEAGLWDNEQLKALGLHGVHFMAFESADYGVADGTCGALLFGDSEGASRALDYMREKLKEEPTTDIAADGLGEESWGLETESLFDGVFYAFRVGNAVMLLYASGDVDAHRLAEKAAERVSAGQ